MSSLGREYLNVEQLAEVGPWSVDAIEKMIRRNIYQRGVHYFQPFGHRTRLIFKWSAIVALIEGKDRVADTSDVAATEKGRAFDVETAKAGLHRLLHR